MGTYESLGVRRVINANARLTHLGGSLMPAVVRDAMRDAADSYVDIHDLQARIGRRIAELSRNEAAYVCTGAAAGLCLSVLACVVGADADVITRLPDVADERREVVMFRAHRMPYTPAVRLAAATVVEVGGDEATTHAELDRAITARTAAVLWVAGDYLGSGALPLSETVRIAHARGVSVIVDAAAQLPPPENLWRFTRDEGADLAIFSGGKDLCGPQASGFVVGRRDLIEGCRANGAPNQHYGRAMKTGKEEMVGLLAAVEWYLGRDHTARSAAFERIVACWVEAVTGLRGVTAGRAWPNSAGQPIPRTKIVVNAAVAGITGAVLARRLWESDPAIAVDAHGEDTIYLTPDCLDVGEEAIIAERLQAVLRSVHA